MQSDRFTFAGHSGAQLSARLDRPAGRVQATALFAHCFTCSKDIPAARRVAQRLAAMGIAVLRFDFTGLGHSEGEFANTDFSSNVADLKCAARALAERIAPPTLLIGHSLGGAAVLRAAADIGGIRAVATIGAPFDPGHVIHNFGSSLEEITRNGQADVSLDGRSFTIRKEFIDNLRAEELRPSIASLRAALLVLHSPTDQIVGIENASDIFLAARHPKSFVTLDNADHLLARPEDADYTAEVIAGWSGRYLGIRRPAAPRGAPEGIVRASEADPQGFLQDISAGPHHHLLADEPEAYGGGNRGMTPYNLLSAGLAACTSMTIRMYARRKGWPLDHVEVDVTHDKIHASDCASCESGAGKIDVFTRQITLAGELSEDQRARLLAIADRCPVHQTLEGEIAIRTSLA